MKINKADLKDSALLLFISLLSFIAVSDSVFPIVIFAIKGILYMFGSIMAILGLSVLVRLIFGKSQKESNTK